MGQNAASCLHVAPHRAACRGIMARALAAGEVIQLSPGWGLGTPSITAGSGKLAVREKFCEQAPQPAARLRRVSNCSILTQLRKFTVKRNVSISVHTALTLRISTVKRQFPSSIVTENRVFFFFFFNNFEPNFPQNLTHSIAGGRGWTACGGGRERPGRPWRRQRRRAEGFLQKPRQGRVEGRWLALAREYEGSLSVPMG